VGFSEEDLWRGWTCSDEHELGELNGRTDAWASVVHERDGAWRRDAQGPWRQRDSDEEGG